MAADEGNSSHSRAVGELARMVGGATSGAALIHQQGVQEVGAEVDNRFSPLTADAAGTVPNRRRRSPSGGGQGCNPAHLTADEARSAVVESCGLSELTTAIHLAADVALRAYDEATRGTTQPSSSRCVVVCLRFIYLIFSDIAHTSYVAVEFRSLIQGSSSQMTFSLLHLRA